MLRVRLELGSGHKVGSGHVAGLNELVMHSTVLLCGTEIPILWLLSNRSISGTHSRGSWQCGTARAVLSAAAAWL